MPTRVRRCEYRGNVWYVIDEAVGNGLYITWPDHYSTEKAALRAIEKELGTEEGA